LVKVICSCDTSFSVQPRWSVANGEDVQPGLSWLQKRSAGLAIRAGVTELSGLSAANSSSTSSTCSGMFGR
jgi:hypothetical protein